MERLAKQMLITFSALVVLLIMVSFITAQHPLLGKNPTEQRMEFVQNSPNFQNGKF